VETGEVGTALRLVGEDDARAVEDDLGRHGLELDVLGAHYLSEDQHPALGLDPVLPVGLLIRVRRSPQDPLERGRGAVRELVIRLHDPTELVPARSLADDLLVPGEIEPARVKGVHLPAA
jgi:hypothetical protein